RKETCGRSDDRHYRLCRNEVCEITWPSGPSGPPEHISRGFCRVFQAATGGQVVVWAGEKFQITKDKLQVNYKTQIPNGRACGRRIASQNVAEAVRFWGDCRQQFTKLSRVVIPPTSL